MAAKKKAAKKTRAGKQYELTARGIAAIEKDELGPQASLIAKALKQKGQVTAAVIAQAVDGKLKTGQPVVRVASYYLGQFKVDGLVRVVKAAKAKVTPINAA